MAVLGGAAASWPLAQQPGKLPTVGRQRLSDKMG
jgi:hypothetical protein